MLLLLLLLSRFSRAQTQKQPWVPLKGAGHSGHWPGARSQSCYILTKLTPEACVL